MILTELQQSILKVVCYFDGFNHPVTVMEIYQWSVVADTLLNFQQSIQQLIDDKVIEQKNGLYFLAGKDHLLGARHSHDLQSWLLLKTALHYARLFRWIPFVRGVALSGSTAYRTATAASDIDLFIVVKDRHLWTVRFMVNTFLRLKNIRPSNENKSQRICCSFFASESALNLQYIRHYFREYHFQIWLAHFSFLYDFGRNNFFSDNAWLSAVLPHWQPIVIPERFQVINGRMAHWLIKISEVVFQANILELLFKKIQFHIMPDQYTSMADDQEIIITDQIIKIHTNPDGRQYQTILDNKFNALVGEL